MFPDAGASPYFLQNQQQLFHGIDGIGIDAAFPGDGDGGLAVAVPNTHRNALLYNLSVVKDKVQQLQPLVGLAVGRGQAVDPVVPGASAVVQEIIAAATSMLYALQHLQGLGVLISVNDAPTREGAVDGRAKNGAADDDDQDQQAMVDAMRLWQQQQQHHGGGHDKSTEAPVVSSSTQTTVDTTIIELDAAELLAKYTHYCQVCGKGFKRDANLRMHMRAHGDEYKSKAALANPTTRLFATSGDDDAAAAGRSRKNKYSCPQDGCRWNRRHAKFQPLKSVICVKNQYKRSHCPKMYVCNRCNRKHFSVLSDLRTHEKHCGDHRWVCSCGTTFSRKDKLAGHVSLFAGHQPVAPTTLASKRSLLPTSSDLVGNCATGFSIT